MNFIKKAFESNYIAPLGPMVDAFEREFAEKMGIPNAVAVASGTATMPWWNSFTSAKLAWPRLNKLRHSTWQAFHGVNIPQGKHLALRILGIGQGDEVIASTLTFIGGELAEDLFNRGLCLASGTAMKEEDLNRVISVILSCKRQKAGSLDRRRHVRIYSTRANIL